MSSIRIEQYSGMSLDGRGLMQMPVLPACGPAIVLDATATSQASTELEPSTRVLRVRVSGTPAVAFRVGSVALLGGDPVALTTDPILTDGEVAFFGVDPGLFGRDDLKVAVIDA